MSAQNNPVSSIVEEENTLTVKVPVETGSLTHSFTIEGQVRPNNDFEISESQDNSIIEDGEATRAVNIIGGPKGVDSFDYRGSVVDANVPEQADVYLNGKQIAVQDLLDYYSNGGSSPDKPGNNEDSGLNWDNPWLLVSAAGVGVSALGIVQRQFGGDGS